MAITYQIIVTDKTDFILKYAHYSPTTKAKRKEMLKFIDDHLDIGDIKISKWDSKGNRI